LQFDKQIELECHLTSIGPDKNGVELYWDKPKTLWPYDSNQELQMFTKALDLNSLIAELQSHS